jgi:hypothetical protein
VFDQPYSSIFVQNRNPIWTNKTPKTLNEKEHIIMAEPYFFHHVNQCFAKFGRFDLMMQYFKDGWIQMLERGGTTIWETWGDQGSLCHAWCTTPAYDLMTHCLGIKITEPGAQKIIIAPNMCGLSWVKGSVPTNLGNVNVEWNWNESLKQITIQYNAPRIIGVEFKAPIINGQLPETLESSQPNTIIYQYKI